MLERGDGACLNSRCQVSEDSDGYHSPSSLSDFAFTISFHIIFSAFTIGLAAGLPVLEAMDQRIGPAGLPRVRRTRYLSIGRRPEGH